MSCPLAQAGWPFGVPSEGQLPSPLWSPTLESLSWAGATSSLGRAQEDHSRKPVLLKEMVDKIGQVVWGGGEESSLSIGVLDARMCQTAEQM